MCVNLLAGPLKLRGPRLQPILSYRINRPCTLSKEDTQGVFAVPIALTFDTHTNRPLFFVIP